MPTKKRILLVDDDNTIRRNYRDVLEDAGYLVVDYELADDWKGVVDNTAFDLALLDISINGDRSTGHTICETLKSLRPTMRVVMLTSLDDDYNRAIANKNGADGYWIKSACLENFLARVDTILTMGIDRDA